MKPILDMLILVSIRCVVEMSNEKSNLELRDLSVWKYVGIFSIKVLIMAMEGGEII